MSLVNVKIVFGIITTLVVGVWTYNKIVKEGYFEQKLDLEYLVHCGIYDESSFIVTTKLILKNTGKVEAKVEYVDLRIKQISPRYESKSIDMNKFNMLPPNDPKTLWPMLGQREWKAQIVPIKILSGTTHDLDADFLILKKAKLVRLYAFLESKSEEYSDHEIFTFATDELCN